MESFNVTGIPVCPKCGSHDFIRKLDIDSSVQPIEYNTGKVTMHALTEANLQVVAEAIVCHSCGRVTGCADIREFVDWVNRGCKENDSLMDNMDYSRMSLELDNGSEVFGYLYQGRLPDKERAKLADGYHIYQIRHADDDDYVPCTLERYVCVNFYGTFVTPAEVHEVDSSGMIAIHDWNFCG